ncbi:Shiga toxin A subunit, partial [Salmonella enterica subsp. enterica serovar Typhimurium]
MVCLLVGVPAISYAHDYGCATVGASMESSLFDAIKNDLNIDVATIIKDKTKVEILDISPVSKVYAESLARMDYEKDKAKNKVAILDKKSYFDSYYENQVKSIVAKFFIASSFMNADECSVRFNGYITLS